MVKLIRAKLKIIFLIIITLSLASCVETIVVGAAAGGSLMTREKSFESTRHDVVIASKLGLEFIANGLKNPGNSVDITVNEGRVLLTGIIRDQNKIRLPSRLAWKVEGVREVIDEIQISQDSSLRPRDFSRAAADYGLTLEIESKLLLKRGISSTNYKVTTVDGTIYLFGIAGSESELQRTLDLISKTLGVKKIVNHAILANDLRRG